MPEVIPTLEANPSLNGAAHVPTIASPDSLQIREHLDFLDRMAAQNVVSGHVAECAREIWIRARQETGNRLPIPAATASEEGHIRYCWDRAEHHLEIEIPRIGPPEFFYRNWITDEACDADVTLVHAFPEQVLQYLNRIVTVPD